MKNNLKLRLVAVLLCLVMLFSTACTAQTTPAATTVPPTNVPATTVPTTTAPSSLPENGTEKVIEQTYTLYLTAEASQDIHLAHYEKTPEILLIDLNTAYDEFFGSLLTAKGTYTYDETETTLTITRNNGAYCVLDFVADTISFNNFDLFSVFRSEHMSDLLAFPYMDADGNSLYLKKTDGKDIAGLSICIDLAARNIPLDIYEGKKYIPFQTFNDIFLAPYSYNFAFNGEALFLVVNGELNVAHQSLYYSVTPKKRSEALAEFTANELCLLLDLYYGLQDEHGILVGFNTFLEYTGLWDDFTSPSPAVASAAVANLTLGYLADIHSSLKLASPYSGSHEPDTDLLHLDKAILRYYQYGEELAAARAEAMPEGVPGYQEVGNTAYITFDSFTVSPIRAQPYSEDSTQIVDTMGLIIYAHSMITREDSPIENVVLDLSCNHGGAVDAAAYVVAWMLGYCTYHITNAVTNSYSTTTYVADVNLDGEFDEKDTIADKNLFCIISNTSFSNANTVPALLKESGKVTLLGDTSGGGACTVQYGVTADGTIFSLSSPYRMSMVSNGAYYTVDRGVEPHHHFSKFESYFNRERLTDYINGLM